MSSEPLTASDEPILEPDDDAVEDSAYCGSDTESVFALQFNPFNLCDWRWAVRPSRRPSRQVCWITPPRMDVATMLSVRVVSLL